MDAVDMATGGLLLSWLVHDLEEYATMPNRVPPFVEDLSFVPEDLRRHGPSRTQIAVGMALVGTLVAAASADGHRTHGRSRFFQSVFRSYGVHSLTHIASVPLAHRYVPGAVTALSIVLPYWFAAGTALRADGVRMRPYRWTLPALPVALLAANGVGHLVSRLVARHRDARSE